MDLTIQRRKYAADDQSWLGSAHGTNAGVTITLDLTTFAKETHYPDGFLKSGLPLSQRASGSWGLAEAEKLGGFLLTPVAVPADTSVKVGASAFVHGVVREGKLPVTVTAEQKAANPAFVFIEEVNSDS